MYLVGAAHPHKTEAQVILERLIASGQRLVTDAEVLQEILHRYTAINKREAIRAALQAIEKADVLRGVARSEQPDLLPDNLDRSLQSRLLRQD